jgi:hypothetical protein
VAALRAQFGGHATRASDEPVDDPATPTDEPTDEREGTP